MRAGAISAGRSTCRRIVLIFSGRQEKDTCLGTRGDDAWRDQNNATRKINLNDVCGNHCLVVNSTMPATNRNICSLFPSPLHRPRPQRIRSLIKSRMIPIASLSGDKRPRARFTRGRPERCDGSTCAIVLQFYIMRNDAADPMPLVISQRQSQTKKSNEIGVG